ncbi:hypothetical protein [Vibrio sp. WZ-1]|uniref:hypothetical protein n=1 Tax=Vibrio sp. WZ-1 TaxID=3454501 RepID=UPI003F84BA52
MKMIKSCIITAVLFVGVFHSPVQASTDETKLDSYVVQDSEIHERINDIEDLLSSIKYQLETNSQNIKNIKTKIDVSEVVNSNLDKINALYIKQQDLSKNLSIQLSKQNILINELNADLESVYSDVDTAERQLSKFNSMLVDSKVELKGIADDLTIKLTEANNNTNSMVNDLSNGARDKFTLVGLGLVVMLLIVGIVIIVLRRRIEATSIDMEHKLHSARLSLEEESLNLDNKLLEVFEKQLNISKENKALAEALLSENQDVVDELDHSLSLRVADEITRMQKNISQMDPSIKAIKPLMKGLERIRKNFMANGYEIIDLLNKPYDERMNMDVINYIDDSTLEREQKVIVKVIRPQVNFNGVLIQRAQVDVATN